ncbi:MAG TPA: M3 family metallopeptidase [Myxococcaceae bacterium]|nr:M3 family metallopeptidase [Myxococcaceae bacterium]
MQTQDAAQLLTGTPEAFLAASRADMERARTEVAHLKGMATPRDPVAALAAYDTAMGALDDATARASVCRNAHPDPKMREAADLCEQEVEALKTELGLDREIYDALSALDVSKLDGATRHFVTRTLRNFRRAGVDKDEATRARLKALSEELVRIGQEFGKNIKDDVRNLEVDPAALDGLPDDFKQSHPVGPNGKVTLTTDNPDYQPFLTYSRDEKAREAMWRLYRQRAHPQNGPVLRQMLERRRDQANLLGYPSWAAYTTEDKMIKTEQAAADFIERVATVSGERMKRDYEQLLARKRKDVPSATQVPGWDSAFYQERVKAEQYDFDSQTVRPYFEYSRVRQGVLDITGRLFGIQYVRVTDAPVWHPDVEVFDVREGKKALGRIYLDMHPREGKYKHYAQFVLTKGVDGVQLPQGVLICNFPRPPDKAGGAPALMEHEHVQTFFHEFGHLLHHVFGGHVKWAGLSGVETEWDFVEAPSQMLEEWCWDPETLGTFARHIDTGEPIPAELVKKAKAANEYGKGLFVRQQMFYAALSLQLHARDPKGLDLDRVAAELQERYTPFKPVPDTYMHESFGHLDGYSAIYYTYMWSLVIAKDLFSVFRKEGLLNPAPAQRYRRSVLEPGGSKPADELVKDFLGRAYDFSAYEEWLNAA